MSALAHIPGSLGFPVIGDTVHFLKTPQQFFSKKQKKYGNIFKFRMFGKQQVCLMGAEANRFVLIEQSKCFSNKEGWQLIGELFHGGLMLRDGEEHKSHRGILQIAFKKEALINYAATMQPLINNYINKIVSNKEIIVFPYIKELTLQLAGKIFFNLEFSTKIAHINKAIIDIVAASITPLHIQLPFTTYGKGMAGRKILKNYFSIIIKERRQSPGTDMLSNLCVAKDENNNTLSDEEIIDHLIFFIMAAHDTTASSITSIIYELAKNQHWQQELRAECSNLFSEKNNKIIGYQQLDALEKMSLVIKETLRLHAPLILIPRKATKDMEFEGIKIPANTNVTVLLYHNHYSAQYFENPTLFNPNRFSAEINEHKKCPYAYAPFGAGQHYCLGFTFADVQMKLILCHLIANYKWTLPANYIPDYINIPIQHPKDGLRMIFTKIA